MSAINTVLLFLILIAVIGLLVYFIIVGLPAISGNLNDLVTFSNSAISQVQAIAAQVFSEVSGLLSTSQQFIIGVAQNISASISAGLTIVYNGIVQLGTQIFNALVDIFNSIKLFVISLSSSVLQFYQSVIAPIINQLVAVYDFIRDNVVQPVVNLINQIIAALNSL